MYMFSRQMPIRNRMRILYSLALVLTLLTFQNCAPFRPSASVKKVDSFSFGDGVSYVPKCVPSSVAPKAGMHRLSNKEYANSIKDIFDVDVGVTTFPIGDKAGDSGFTNDYGKMNTMSLLADDIISGYFTAAVDISSKIMTDKPNSVLGLGCAQSTDECYGQIISKLALRLFRHPLGTVVGDPTAASFLTLMKSQSTKADGAKLVLMAMLSSPSFLYRTYGTFAADNAQAVALNKYEIASRLSFFLWASSPDLTLLNADLTQPDVLDAQVDRMLTDSKALRLATVFGDEWTRYSDIKISSIPSEFGVSDAIRVPASTESEKFIDHVMTSSPRALDMFDANYSYLNQGLANLYDISGVTGPDVQLVTNLGSQRGGFLSQMSFLTATSGGDTDTHPVKRGNWIATQAMCIEIGDIPDGVDTDPDIPGAKTPREFAAIHAQGDCKSCHSIMDPIGFGMENYDAIGQWRTEYVIGDDWGGKGLKVEPEGSLTGKNFSGPDELKTLIAHDVRTHMCLSRKFMSYAVGRELTNVDFCDAEKIGSDVIGRDGSIREVVKRIAKSNAFTRGGR